MSESLCKLTQLLIAIDNDGTNGINDTNISDLDANKGEEMKQVLKQLLHKEIF